MATPEPSHISEVATWSLIGAIVLREVISISVTNFFKKNETLDKSIHAHTEAMIELKVKFAAVEITTKTLSGEMSKLSSKLTEVDSHLNSVREKISDLAKMKHDINEAHAKIRSISERSP